MNEATAEAPSGNDVVFKSQLLTIEQVIALYFDSDSIVAQPEPVYRFDSSKQKFYYTFNPITMRPEYFMAVTTLLAATLPTPAPIVEKMVELGKAGFDAYRNERSLYGTMMDIEFNKFLIAGTYDMEAIPDIVRTHHQESGSRSDVKAWIDEFNTDITSFAQWIFDYNVKPLAIGIMLVSRQLQIGGQLDLVCEMNDVLYTDKTPLAQRKRVRRIVDYKSGKSGFYDSHKLQLEGYKECWNENFSIYPIDGIANFAPKAWLKEPTYSFKDHTGDDMLQKLPHLIELARIDGMMPKRDVKIFTGQLEKGKAVTESQFKVVPVDELIVSKMISRL